MPKTEQRDKRVLSSTVKRALTFTRAKLDVALYSIQNINLGQNVAATCPVIKPIDCKKKHKSRPNPLACAVTQWFHCKGELHVAWLRANKSWVQHISSGCPGLTAGFLCSWRSIVQFHTITFIMTHSPSGPSVPKALHNIQAVFQNTQ